MRMSIDEAHGILSNGLVNAPSEHEWCVAFKMAIDTMRKYQKIEQIIKEWGDSGLLQNQLYKLISEVVDNGNDGV